MLEFEHNSGPDAGVAGQFATTHWSVVLLAGENNSTQAVEALEKLCRTYWYPLYAFVRREGHSPEEAADLTQELFSRLLADNSFARVSRSKGKFRSFLLAAMKHLLANEWHRSQTQKRGGGAVHFSLDAFAAEDRYQLDPPDASTAETIFDQRWAEALVDSVTSRLQAEFTTADMAGRFEALKVFLLVDEEPASYAQTAQKLGLTESAVKSAIHRMRQRYGELLRTEIANTVTNPLEMEEELRHFVAVLSR